ncbi:NitT/TauT family transport system substrate-binding protein [Homoserinimonas aerilata]|uniref:NitT/TauT family transport system substrate-binding protein n=1 Tax=Homoserinimonas aerilata TaxID=1162970 RepID=A0A542YHN8_9MICO|nr:ABC transporter substrate-binding protein [Homoserinimonas aerilata]TQL47531.1 NitT/TauT family transport system substrate-binding protein [Homoserinimonas aerilata]
MERIAKFSSLAALAAITLALTGCASGSPSGETATPGADSGDLIPITVGLLPIAPAAMVQYGIDQGIFEEHGLDVTTQIAQGGAAMLPAVSTGQLDFGVGNPLSVLVAAGQGVDVRVASGYSFSLADGVDINAVVTRAGDGIDSWADLEGKRVSVNAVNTQGDLTIKDAIDGDGGDSSTVEFIEIAFPDALAQLDSNNVDAVWIPEPFLSRAVAAPETYSVLGYPNQVAIPGLPTMVTFTSGAIADEQVETVQKWREAIDAVIAAAEADKDGFAATIAEFTGMPLEAAQSLRLERFSADLDPKLLSDLTEMASEYGFMDNAPDLKTVLIP